MGLRYWSGQEGKRYCRFVPSKVPSSSCGCDGKGDELGTKEKKKE